MYNDNDNLMNFIQHLCQRRIHVFDVIAFFSFFATIIGLMFCDLSKGSVRQSKKLELESVWKFQGYKTILAYDIPSKFNIKDGPSLFTDLECSQLKCILSSEHDDRSIADLVLFHEHYVETYLKRSPKQIYALYYMTDPFHNTEFPYKDIINWTISYRYDSYIAAPFSIWWQYDSQIEQMEQPRNYSEGKTKKVAAIFSDCNDKNGRLTYAKELQKYIEVDIYGDCGTMRCPNDDIEMCYEMLDKDYKFYLAFEIANCRDYITETYFDIGMGRNVLPIVMGAHYDEYEESSPKNSFIHVDEFECAKDLAKYLDELDKDDAQYQSYFLWKGTGKFLTRPKDHFCEMCSQLHNEKIVNTHIWYGDVNLWWRGGGICVNGTWNKPHGKSNE